MKTLLTTWISCASVALPKTSVELDVKIDIMKMCFRLIQITNISQDEIEMTFQTLCELVEVGIQNGILQYHPLLNRLKHALGHGFFVKQELEVSCFSGSILCIESLDLLTYPVPLGAGVEFCAL